MQGVIKIGTVGEERFVVSEQHLIDFAHEGMPRVLCTPWLIWFLEHAASNTMLPLLEPGDSTVGVVVNVEHTAATPVGSAVVCRARVIYTDGRKVGRGDDPTWSPDGFVTRAFPDRDRGGPKIMIETKSGEKELPIVPRNKTWGRFTWIPPDADRITK